jgi:hypothetical protein
MNLRANLEVECEHARRENGLKKACYSTGKRQVLVSTKGGAKITLERGDCK